MTAFKNKISAIKLIGIFAFIFIFQTKGLTQRIDIDRIERMPNFPAPYEMRDWKKVAIGYDSLVFDLQASGQYLPLIQINHATINYPEQESFILHSYVGTHNPLGAEAINILPAVIGASLAGIDKSDQFGYNWPLMCEEFFNNRPQENVYLNNPVGNSGNDWWYDTMPNVFFYQLYDLYPGSGDFERQFRLVADRWLEAVKKMGGQATPWQRPYMNYRAWSLSTMSPLTVGVKEPEAAGAIAWILYHAYARTKEEKYRIGAEWAMEFLDKWQSNPAYELQLPYGVYAAARMNAELGTKYDVEKMVNWCFDAKENVRSWGATLGNWGGYDCDGLIGEAKYAGYAFAMNGFEMAGALVPMVRYDERFARAVGKWMLNLANASRLFYWKFLPDEHQDGEEWAKQFDPNSYIAHEALREYGRHTGISPFATGDAVEGGWAETNFALYGSSHVGILGAIVDTTDVPYILKLDLRKTDYFQHNGFPVFLLFNPYDSPKYVTIDVGSEGVKIYEVISNTFLTENVSGEQQVEIPANDAIIVEFLPANGKVSFDLDKMLVNGEVADYHSGSAVSNFPPRIKALAAADTVLVFGDSTRVYCTAEDREGNLLLYHWKSQFDSVSSTESSLTWIAPDTAGNWEIQCIADDQHGGLDTAIFSIKTVAFVNHNPEIIRISAAPRRVEKSGQSQLVCSAWDEDGDSLNFQWSAEAGTISANDSLAAWTAPEIEGFYYIRCQVSDPHGGSALDSIGIVVQDSTNITIGIPLAYYPFRGNANDESGNDFHGIVQGATLTTDSWGNEENAYFFNGSYALIRVPNDDLLNFQEAITVSFWMNIDELFNRESYPISHGSWKNRWKISITPEKKLRWTVYTNIGIKDLDSQTAMQTGVNYNVTTVYDGERMKIYLNGNLDNAANHSGRINKTAVDLTIGQELPDSDYNFKGLLDEIRIYDYALSDEEIQNIFRLAADVKMRENAVPDKFYLWQNFPNPFNSITCIRYQNARAGKISLVIFDILGRRVRTLVDEFQPSGVHELRWDGRNDSNNFVSSGIYICEFKAFDFSQKKKFLFVK
ncbi:MAG: laminin G [Calditrichaeota bacterium]|nr:laminin G [Calditrichota bacterium]